MDKFDLVLGKGQTTTFHASLSILGGLIDEKFQDLFASASTAGWYDRFIFGQCPDGFLFDYQPFFGKPQKLSPCAVSIDSEVWTEKAMWLRQEPEMTARVAELAIRAAAICASFDQRRVLYAKDLGPALEFARYQTRIRAVLKPNPGENFEGKIAYKILDYLARYQGKFVSKRTMMLAIHANRYGPTTAARCFDVLCSNGEIESTKVGKCELVRLTPENHPLPVVLPPEAE
jgi:hypothetical protein